MKKNFNFNQRGKALNYSSSGQAILTVILVMVVALTIGLSISGRSVTDIKMSAQMEESQRAFSAAEAGVEAALYSGQGGSATVGNASYRVRILKSGDSEFLFPNSLSSDEFGYAWLVNPEELDTEVYDKNSIRVLWGNQNPNWSSEENTPALEVIIIYKDGNLSKLGKFALDPRIDRSNNFCLSNGSNCVEVSNFKTNGETVSGENLQFSADLDLSNFRGSGKIVQLLAGKLFYNSNKQMFGVKALDGGSLPSQGKVIESTGVAGQTARKVQVYQLNPMLPSVFDYGVFSVSNIVK